MGSEERLGLSPLLPSNPLGETSHHAGSESLRVSSMTLRYFYWLRVGKTTSRALVTIAGNGSGER